MGEDNDMWWPACVTRINKRKNEIEVEDETGYVQTIKLNNKKHQERLAVLGTHTRNARAYSDNSNKDDEVEVDNSFNHDLFVINKKFDILDIYKSNQTGKVIKKWRPATIVEVIPPDITVKFDGWEDKHNISLTMLLNRVQELNHSERKQHRQLNHERLTGKVRNFIVDNTSWH